MELVSTDTNFPHGTAQKPRSSAKPKPDKAPAAAMPRVYAYCRISTQK